VGDGDHHQDGHDAGNGTIGGSGGAPGSPCADPLLNCLQGTNWYAGSFHNGQGNYHVIEAFLEGLDRRLEAGLPLRPITSVASFFVSRVDGKVDPLLDGNDAPPTLRGTAAIANACMAYHLFEESLTQRRWNRLAESGAQPQRPLWASTSTKDPSLPDVYYIEALIAPDTVNTIPPEQAAEVELAAKRLRQRDVLAAWRPDAAEQQVEEDARREHVILAELRRDAHALAPARKAQLRSRD